MKERECGVSATDYAMLYAVMKDRYICKKCGRTEYFDSKRKTHPCPECSRKMKFLYSDADVGKYALEGSELPGYRELLTEIESSKGVIIKEKKDLEQTDNRITATQKQIDEHMITGCEYDNEVSEYRNQLRVIDDQIESGKAGMNSRVEEYKSQLSTLSGSIDRLMAEKKSCSVFSRKRKKELEAQILAEKEKEQSVRSLISKAEADFLAFDEKKTIEQKAINYKMEVVERKKKTWESEQQQISRSLYELQNHRQELMERIKKHEKDVSLAEKNAEKISEEWKELIAETEKKEEIEKKQEEKGKLISGLKIPVKKYKEPGFDKKKLNLEESVLNDAYIPFKSARDKREDWLVCRKYTQNNAKTLEKVKSINLFLGLDEMDGIEDFVCQDEPEKSVIQMPERFVYLNRLFMESESWKNLVVSAKIISNKKTPRSNAYDAFFSGMEYIKFSVQKVALLLFPYCAVVCKSDKMLHVYTYDGFMVDKRYEDIEETTEEIPEDCDLIGQKYTHQNADGSPDKRYKNNPIISIYRYSWLSFFSNKNEIIGLYFDRKDLAASFADAYAVFRNGLLNGKYKDIYSMVIKEKDVSEIEKEISRQEKEEEERKKQRIEAARAEEKRLEEERAAAEKQKQEIIKRQREQNEERKRQAEEQRQHAMKVAELFGDDFGNDSISSALQENTECVEDSHDLPVRVEGNRMITNTVFKIILKPGKDFSDDGLSVYFTDNRKTVISNRKKVIMSSDDNISLGFVLNSGFDYTTLKKCFLCLEKQNEVIGQIEFKMNIAFSPDDF